MIQESLKINPYSQIAVLGTIDHSSKIIRPAAREVITNFDEASFSLKFLARKNGNHTLDLKKNPQVSILLVLNEKKDQVNNLVIYGTAKKTSCAKKDCVYTVQPALIKISHSFGLTDDEINQKMKLGYIDVNMIHKNKFWYTSEVSIRDYKKSTNGTWKVIRDIEKGL